MLSALDSYPSLLSTSLIHALNPPPTILASEQCRQEDTGKHGRVVSGGMRGGGPGSGEGSESGGLCSWSGWNKPDRFHNLHAGDLY